MSESFQESMPIEIKLHKMQLSIDFIFTCIKSLESKSQHISELLSGGSNIKRPHKCPVCDGKGNIKTEIELKILKFDLCNACESKGVVWG